MENRELQAVVDKVLGRLFIELEASGRHVHVTKEQAQRLFGHGLTPKRPLSQPGQFLANERVTVKGPKGEFQNVAVLGPERKEAQVEISLTDGRTLGIQPPVRLSGDVKDSPGTVLTGPAGIVRRGLAYYGKVWTYKAVRKIAPAYAEKRFGSKEYRTLSPIMKESYKKIVNEDLRECAERVENPTLIIEGKSDVTTPLIEAQIYQKHLKKGELKQINGGHFAFAENPVPFNLLVEEFLYE